MGNNTSIKTVHFILLKYVIMFVRKELAFHRVLVALGMLDIGETVLSMWDKQAITQSNIFSQTDNLFWLPIRNVGFGKMMAKMKI